MLWEVDIYPKSGQPDLEAARVNDELAALGLQPGLVLRAARGFLIETKLSRDRVEQLARELLVDRLVEDAFIHNGQPADTGLSVHVLPKPGVMDPVALSVQKAAGDLGFNVAAVRTLKKYCLQPGVAPPTLDLITGKVLANASIEQVIIGALCLTRLDDGTPYQFALRTVAIRDMSDDDLLRLSREGQLYLNRAEMQTLRDHYRRLGRDATDAELETLAQTWSEHCSHKTLKGRIEYRELAPDGNVLRDLHFENLLAETIFSATRQIREQLGERDWCASVFEDNAGVVRFDDHFNVCFKVETHNHPSAIEPYGGANTGLGGVIRDSLGTGLGAKPIANTDVFCFAPPDYPLDRLPPGVLHPKKVMKGVVAGVRDYGNRMGIPTVNGAIFFDERYLANPLVFCGNVGLIPRDRSKKQAHAGDLIVAVGGRTGRDGIHGATFSSAELTHESESVSGGAVQIGNAITEKKLVDVLLQARDLGLYTAITDCGAGGFSSAVGEMGERLGAEVWLDRVPLKYAGLSYTEIWISEAQERMVLAVPPDQWDELDRLCLGEDVEATVIGRFGHSGERAWPSSAPASAPRLLLKYNDHPVADLDMHFLHDGRPPLVRRAEYRQPAAQPLRAPVKTDYTDDLKKILSSLNVCSKEWVIRQYDHEVQGTSVIKPLVGASNDGPSDAAVIRPVLDSYRGLAIACGMNPRYGDLDPYWMAASAIDEAIRNCVAVGADPDRIALLDNFCWGNTGRPDRLGTLVRAVLACRDMALAYGAPFISGKDSLNNEFTYTTSVERAGPSAAPAGETRTIAIPPSLLISALGQIDDVRQCVTMDLKEPGDSIYLVGRTCDELGGSHYALVDNLSGGSVPEVDPESAKAIFGRLHQAIRSALVRACHDLSEGGLAAALAEMAFAGNCGARISLKNIPGHTDLPPNGLLFSESNSRFLVEVPPSHARSFEQLFAGLPCVQLGTVVAAADGLDIQHEEQTSLVRASLEQLKDTWQRPLRW